jgi:CDP-glycerol glycerophosphotransferase (TagB/SpsB family)
VVASRSRIVFFALRDLHIDVLRPVLRAVVALGRYDVGISAPPFVESGQGRVQEGLSPATCERLAAEGVPFWGHARDGEYACVVVADACYDRVDGWGPVVCIGHGTISKGLYFSDVPYTRRENFARVLCVPGPGYVTSFGRQLFTNVVPTGFSKMDELAHPPASHRFDVLSALGLDPAKRTVLFAPTYNPEFTALYGLEPAWSRLDATRDQVLFKLHGVTDPATVARYRALAASLPHARLVDGTLATYMLASDVIVSDVSSAYVEGLVTGKPLIVYDNPAMTTYPLFNCQDVEYRVRDAAYRVGTPDELLERLERLRHDDPLAGRRQRYAGQLFPPVDGRNSERIAAEIAAVADGTTPQRFPGHDGAITAYVPDDVIDIARIDANIRRAASRVTVQRGGPAPRPPFVVLTGAFDLPSGWDLVWSMARHFNSPSRKQSIAGVFGPVLPDSGPYGKQRRSACFSAAPHAPEATLQTRYKHHAYDKIIGTDMLEADGSIVSAGVPREIADAWVRQLADANGRRTVLKQVVQRGLAVGVLAGVYATPLDQPVDVARPDFLFYCFKNVHLPLFAPVIAAVRRLRPDATIAFASPACDPAAREGLTLEERDAFAAETGATWVADAVQARPRVTIVADAVADRLRGHQRIVNLGHGLISKGQYYGAYPLIGRENLAHEICVPGPWHAEQLRPHLYIPIHVTGMSKLDGLFAPFDEAAFRETHGFRRDERLLLWCPTFNPELTGLTVIGAGIRRLTEFGTVIIKMHGTTDRALATRIRTELTGDPRIRFVDGAADVTPYMRCASLMITDVSSVMFEFAALDRPLVLVDNPRQSAYVNYRPDDVEYRMRDVGPRVTNVDELVAAVREELAQPMRFSTARRAMTTAMFAATDGGNSARIARVLCTDGHQAPWLDRYDVVVHERLTAEDLRFVAPGLAGAANVIGPAAAAAGARDLPYRPFSDLATRDALVAGSESPNLVMVRRRVRLIGDWRAPLLGPLYLAHDAPSLTSPLTTERSHAASYVGRYVKRDRVTLPKNVNADLLAQVIRLTNPGERVPDAEPDPAVIALRRESMTLLDAGTRTSVVLDALAAG